MLLERVLSSDAVKGTFLPWDERKVPFTTCGSRAPGGVAVGTVPGGVCRHRSWQGRVTKAGAEVREGHIHGL